MTALRLRDGAWVIAGQGLTAMGTLVSIRVLTQTLSPDTFGAVSLFLGVCALAMSLICTPFTQAAIHLYPEYAADDRQAILWHSILAALRRIAPYAVLAALALAALAMWSQHVSFITCALALALLIGDCWRSMNLSFLNAGRQHRRFGLWMAADVWVRPLCAVVAVWLLGQSVDAVLLAFVVASLGLAIAFRSTAMSLSSGRGALADDVLAPRIWRYALPLIPLGAIGWANGLSDRYIVAGMLDVADVGIYAAAYGLASRPMLVINAAFEQALRPLYQNAVSTAQHDRAKGILWLWFGVMFGAGALFTAAMWLWADVAAQWLLGPEFRSGARLMPWIALGYALLCLSYVFERVCYATAQTKRVLAIQSCTAVAAVVTTLIATDRWGLFGAAIATPVYFSVQLLAAMWFAFQSSRALAAPKFARSTG